MVDTLPRPEVDKKEYRDLEMGSWQIMMLAHQITSGDLGKCLIIRDICTRIMERWLADERLVQHEIAARQGTPLLAEKDGNIIHLKFDGSP